jgi:hypothetical protein
MGEKHNTARALVPEADVIVPWDDDDIPMPWHITTLIEAIQAGADRAKIKHFWQLSGETVSSKRTENMLIHAGAMTRAILEKAGGYPAMQSGQDQAIAHRIKQVGGVVRATSRPSYLYRWAGTNSPHLSATKHGYERRGREEIVPVSGTLSPRWDRPYLKMVAATNPNGPGTRLKRLLGRLGIRQGGCRCEPHQREMDASGASWVRSHQDVIVGWLREEAKHRHLPFPETLVRRMIEWSAHDTR